MCRKYCVTTLEEYYSFLQERYILSHYFNDLDKYEYKEY